MTATIPPPSARDALRERLRSPLLHFIGGGWVPSESGETFEFLTPTDNSVLGHAASGNAADIDRAAQAAHAAFPAWRALSGKKRRAVLHRVADLIEARADE
ncbi:aldehyde dehydrogenase family protein, partial [uncultured Deinococcus sp.]|uniref:aldehyde dehydrogenase family protein n=1 Tax=uncultured Deinococcus sp. TaxID=158789 RepID=UPI0025E5E14D